MKYYVLRHNSHFSGHHLSHRVWHSSTVCRGTCGDAQHTVADLDFPISISIVRALSFVTFICFFSGIVISHIGETYLEDFVGKQGNEGTTL